MSKYAFFKDGSKRIKDSGKGKLSTPFKSVLKFDKNAYIERQTTGDCVSHATRNACDLTRAVEIDVGDKESWIARALLKLFTEQRPYWTRHELC